ncbi:MAG: hypothetical protein HKN13_05235 [Rhodothermales bacterium]|nr:hypothetical protein [Rhodothermales bacterium]
MPDKPNYSQTVTRPVISDRFAKWNLVGVTLICLLLFFWIDPTGRAAEWQRFIARLHPAVVHLPIGILVVGFILSILRSLKWLTGDDTAIDLTIVLGTWFGVIAIAAGSWLGQMGGYDPDVLFRHKLAGYVVTVFAALVLYLRKRSTLEQPRNGIQYGAWVIVLGALVYGGDLGGRITHGDGFASEYAPSIARLVLGTPPEIEQRFELSSPTVTTVYDGIVAPIFSEKCTSCHGKDRGKGRLRLHTQDAIVGHKGDDPLIVPERSEESLLIQRMSLPEGHEDQMPPLLDAKPIAPADVELLKWWVDEGASFELTIADAPMPPHIRTILDAYGLGVIRRGIFALDIAPPDSNAMEALLAQGARVSPLSNGSPFLSVTCRRAADCFGEGALGALGQHVAWLDAGESDVSDTQLAELSDLPNLVRLDLSKTRIDGSGLESIKNLQYLEYLNLYGSDVDDAALSQLETLTSLAALYLWQTNVSDAAVSQLEAANPQIKINTGATSPSENE